MSRTLRFVTRNFKKYEELSLIISKDGYLLEQCIYDIPETQTCNAEELLRRKALEAYKKVRRPVLVEHTALEISAFNGLPSLQTRGFYDALGYAEIVKYCKYRENFRAKAITYLGFCDGKNITIEYGSVDGTIMKEPVVVDETFDWDCIFCPDIDGMPGNKSYAEMQMKKNEISMRFLAWQKLKDRVEKKLDLFEHDIDGYQSLIKEIAWLAKNKRLMLFIGAGISASMKLPDWKTLMENIGAELGYDKELFLSHGDYTLLAEYSKLMNGKKMRDLLRAETDLSKNPDYKKALVSSEIYALIKQLKVPVIYTTNYDNFIEDYYRFTGTPCNKVVSITDMEEIQSDKIRIMKFHGEVGAPMVLTESEYYQRMDYQHFMDIQLQADLLQYHVLFLGYSLSDMNIKGLLYRARKRWSVLNGGRKDYIFSATPNVIQSEVFKNNGIITINGIFTDKYKSTLQFLSNLLDELLVCN